MEFFKPQLSIKINPNLKSYDVEATVVVPTGCYVKVGASAGAPPDQYTLPEVEPITLAIKSTDGPCIQAPQVLTFKVRWLPLTIGKTTVLAFVTVDGDVVATGSKRIVSFSNDIIASAADTALPPPGSGIEINSVSAWINAQPPQPPSLIAIVNVTAPCLNYEFTFDDKGPFGITGKTRLVELIATLPDACDRVIFEGPVRFETELASKNEFDSIAIEFEGELYLDPLEIVV
ncbi:hypothetical protein [Ruegeria arenilitoris]|uniref:hypothetical protein n=1 Tax=Ruegeria arenilitoris TaxID=1173585 RepID=UPI00147A1E78|nr:hypothetical protein [Ruegeria arenilitoris]